MSRICEYSGMTPVTGNNVSHSQRKTRRTWQPNLQKKTYVIPELGKSITAMLSTRAIRTISKYGGISTALLKAPGEQLSAGLRKVKSDLQKIKA